MSERFTSTTTLTVNIRDDDDQDPSFIYQGCMLLDGACINPEYSASVCVHLFRLTHTVMNNIYEFEARRDVDVAR